MRLHSLEVTAFGPFAGTASVDFDELSDAGLFLLTGPTGAGKSSVLDAVCFALYGDVPGDRAAAKRLRCDTAAEGVAPRVVLEATLGDRRFRLTRSPAWQRPKRRGSGLTTQQASVLIEEITADGPRLLTNRLDEAGQLVSTLLGMNLNQFCQVALLPQGRFQEFLRARSEARHALLQKLFRTRRFDAIERWLRDHRLDLRRQLDARAASVASLAHRVEEVSGAVFDPEFHDAADLDQLIDRWVAEVTARADVGAETTGAHAAVLAEADAATHAALATGTRLAGLQARHRSARVAIDLLARDTAEVDRLRKLLAVAERASPVRAVHELALAARARRAEAERVLAELGHAPDAADDLQGNAEAVRRALAAVPPLMAVETETATLARRSSELGVRIAELTAAEADLERADASWPDQAERLRAQAVAARAATHRIEAARVAVDRGTDRRTAAVELVAAGARLTAAQSTLTQVVDAHQLARETWLTLHEERLHGMAAEIALDLAVGASCPVCGSCDHPQPAPAAAGAPTAGAERAARRAVDDAELLRHAQTDEVRALETRVAVLTEQAEGLSPDEAEAAVGEARRDLARLEPLAATADRLEAELARADEARDGLRRRLAEVRLDRASTAMELEAAQVRRTSLQQVLAEGLGDHPDVRALERSLQRELSRLTQLLAALDAAAAAEAARAEAEAAVAKAARDQGFDRADDAVAGLLGPLEAAAHQRRVADHEQRCGTAQATLAEPDVAVAAQQPAPDLAALSDALALAGEASRAAHAQHEVALGRVLRLRELRALLDDALAAWRPTREAHDLAQRVAAFADGRAADNREQMRLSAYVLAWRLGQVVAAANVRLTAMTDQRFTLEHSTQRGAGETRGGLSLLVRDEWSGESRDPVTLSGGETFVVSLALALGLTDVVTHEAGGADIGTLFVDEGFGSLDADTLDDVMDTLDSLRDGGRAVGIVSHVPELRTRIPTQLRVTKSRTGSGLHQVHEQT